MVKVTVSDDSGEASSTGTTCRIVVVELAAKSMKPAIAV